jgi:hypothetical protein
MLFLYLIYLTIKLKGETYKSQRIPSWKMLSSFWFMYSFFFLTLPYPTSRKQVKWCWHKILSVTFCKQGKNKGFRLKNKYFLNALIRRVLNTYCTDGDKTLYTRTFLKLNTVSFTHSWSRGLNKVKRYGLNSCGSRQLTRADFCVHGNEFLASRVLSSGI